MEKQLVPNVRFDQACKNVSKWAEYAKVNAEKGTLVKAFFIPKDDIIRMTGALLNDNTLAGFRAYIGVEEAAETHEQTPKLYMVATQESRIKNPDGTETVVINDVISKNAVDTPVYDFSRPCPDTCDMNDSPIYLASLQSQKV